MFNLKYIYSACVEITTDDLVVLCDPWLIGPAYYGTWGHVGLDISKVKANLKRPDYIYISHIHPDHYHPATIRWICGMYPGVQILLASWPSTHKNYLALKLRSDGFTNTVETNEIVVKNTRLCIIPNVLGTKSDIDTALYVEKRENGTIYNFLNLNDCFVSDSLANRVQSLLPPNCSQIDCVALGYTGAGPYPQTYYSYKTQLDVLTRKALEKEAVFKDRYLKAINLFPSKLHVPFAGKYKLLGELSILNPYRGVVDAVDVKEWDPQAVVPADNGEGLLDITTGQLSRARLEPHFNLDSQSEQDKESEYLWDKYLGFEPENSILSRLLLKAATAARQKSPLCTKDLVFTFFVYDRAISVQSVASLENPQSLCQKIASINLNHQVDLTDCARPAYVSSDIFISRKALFLALTGVTHWNNYEVGSVLQVRRSPDIYVPEMQDFLNFLSVA